MLCTRPAHCWEPCSAGPLGSHPPFSAIQQPAGLHQPQPASSNPAPPLSLCPQFLGLLRQEIISDVMFLFNPESGFFHSLIAMGPDVCGHPCTVHGGFTSAVIDETTGALFIGLRL